MELRQQDVGVPELAACMADSYLYRVRLSNKLEGRYVLIKEVPVQWKAVEERAMSSAISAALAAERLSYLDEACLGVVYDCMDDDPNLDADQTLAAFRIE